MADKDLNVARSVTLALVGGVVTGRLEMSPDNERGGTAWDVRGVLVTTSRPGLGPVPRAEVYLGDVTPANRKGITYDGSFGPGGVKGQLIVGRGTRLIVIWTGGQAGDLATATVSGKWL